MLDTQHSIGGFFQEWRPTLGLPAEPYVPCFPFPWYLRFFQKCISQQTFNICIFRDKKKCWGQSKKSSSLPATKRWCETGHLHVDTRLGTDGFRKQFWVEESQYICFLTQLTVSESPLFDPLLFLISPMVLKAWPPTSRISNTWKFVRNIHLNPTWNLNQKLWGWDPAICFNKFSTL